jgi:hypothetical protein
MPDSSVEGSTDGRLQFLQFYEQNLSMKPAVSAKDLIKLGKKTSDAPGRLLVKLRSEEVAVTKEFVVVSKTSMVQRV